MTACALVRTTPPPPRVRPGPWRLLLVPTVGLALSATLLAAPSAEAAMDAQEPPSQGRDEPAPAASFEPLIEQFLVALDEVRRGSRAAEASLLQSARALATDFDRADAVEVARFYVELTPAERREGQHLEARFDGLRAQAQEADASAVEADDRITGALLQLLSEARQAVDITAAARTSALLARIEVRQLERCLPGAPGRVDLARRAEEHAELALRWFALAGQQTPQLEALWVRARIALTRGEPLVAERAFRDLADLAERVRRPRWRERALLGLVGVAREQGAPFAADAALEELASFRRPAHCWALTRELAAQRLADDQPGRALELLESFPPSGLDSEIQLGEADGEWRALQAAALLRSGEFERAAAALAEARRVPRPASADVLELTEATLLLDRGDPEGALATLDQRGSRGPTSDLSRVEALVIRGRALLAAGRCSEAVPLLQQAFDEARRRDDARWRGAEGLPRDSSAVGEWLGLSTVEVLASAHVAAGQPLEAAATIEAAHASCSMERARELVLDLAASQSLGLVTWVVGADRSLAVHVRPDGTAEAAEIPRGRRQVLRAGARLKEALVLTRHAAGGEPRDLGWEIASELLPESLLQAIGRWRSGPEAAEAPTLALLAHGALESVAFEALPAGADEAPLGLVAALTIVDRLREPEDLPPRLDGRTARWLALGAPVETTHPDLPGARQELRDLDQLHPRLDSVTGLAFDAPRLLEALGGQRPVHVATHVIRCKEGTSIAPLCLLTSSGGNVSAASIATVAPRLPLLVLATCDSAAGRSVDGLSNRGLAQVALDAGTRAAVVTGWSLSDRYGRAASLAFHASLRSGSSPAEALRRARSVLVSAGAPAAEWAALRFLGTP